MTTELIDDEGTRWVHDQDANTYQPIAPDGDASVPMPAIVFAAVYPELHSLFLAKEDMSGRTHPATECAGFLAARPGDIWCQDCGYPERLHRG